MNDLDELLSSAGRVRGITPVGMTNARAALDAAIAGASAEVNAPLLRPGTPASRKPARRWPGGLRGKTVIGVAAVAAAAAVAAVIILPSPSADSGGSRVANRPGAAARGSKRHAAPGTSRSLNANVTAAYVLHEAAKAAGAQSGGWPNARYWYVKSAYTCGGETYYNSIWIPRYGSYGITENTGPATSDPLCQPSGKTIDVAPTGPKPVGEFGVTKQGLTWSELYTLPTDPARLERLLLAESGLTFSPDPTSRAVWTGEEDFFQDIMGLLGGAPAPPALREALYEVAAKIPGVRVRGDYTDSLGRTGTALRLGIMTMVVNPGDGQLLDEIWRQGPAPTVCGDAGPGHHVRCFKAKVSPGSDTEYISQGPASTEPTAPAGGSGSTESSPSSAPTASSAP
jgi:hypothetical protein